MELISDVRHFVLARAGDAMPAGQPREWRETARRRFVVLDAVNDCLGDVALLEPGDADPPVPNVGGRDLADATAAVAAMKRAAILVEQQVAGSLPPAGAELAESLRRRFLALRSVMGALLEVRRMAGDASGDPVPEPLLRTRMMRSRFI